MLWEAYWAWVLASIVIVPSMCVAAFALWMARVSTATGEVAAKYWDVFVKLISAFTVIFSGAMLFGKYIDQQKAVAAAEETRAVRAVALRKADFLIQKLAFETKKHDLKTALLSEAKQVASRLANQTIPDPEMVLRFDELYLSDLIGIEVKGGDVERAMIAFNKRLKGETEKQSLRNLSLSLSRAVTNELQASENAILEQHREISDLVVGAGKAAPRN